MKLRFKVNQAEAFRRGIDVPKSIVTVEVDPATIEESLRNMIADRMDGIDVCSLRIDQKGEISRQYYDDEGPVRVEAKGPTFDDLVAALREEESRLHREQTTVNVGILGAASSHVPDLVNVDLQRSVLPADRAGQHGIRLDEIAKMAISVDLPENDDDGI